MPTYVYACKKCEHRFELFQSFRDQALTTCPECHEVSLRKVLFPAGVVFKGSGFYVTDSRSANPTTSGADSKKKDEGKKPSGDKAPTSSNGSTAKKETTKSGATNKKD